MRLLLPFLLGGTLFVACSPAAPPPSATRTVLTADHELIVPPDPTAVLVLFPGFGGDTTDTRTGSRIVPEALDRHVAVMLMTLGRRLFLSPAAEDSVVQAIGDGLQRNGLHVPTVVLGGFSAGGNMAVLLAKHLSRTPDPRIPLKGLFVVDAPLDLEQLYAVAQDHLHRSNVAPPALAEAQFLTTFLDSTLGSPTDSAANYQRYSPISDSTSTLSPLKDLPIRLYTEPDTAWWRINRGIRPEDLNAVRLERLYHQLEELGNTHVRFITTQGRGMQHGQRHPHAWSIVEEKDLLRWVEGL